MIDIFRIGSVRDCNTIHSMQKRMNHKSGSSESQYIPFITSRVMNFVLNVELSILNILITPSMHLSLYQQTLSHLVPFGGCSSYPITPVLIQECIAVSASGRMKIFLDDLSKFSCLTIAIWRGNFITLKTCE